MLTVAPVVTQCWRLVGLLSPRRRHMSRCCCSTAGWHCMHRGRVFVCSACREDLEQLPPQAVLDACTATCTFVPTEPVVALLFIPLRREDLEQLPPEADLDAYAAMPVEQFGMALLRWAITLWLLGLELGCEGWELPVCAASQRGVALLWCALPACLLCG